MLTLVHFRTSYVHRRSTSGHSILTLVTAPLLSPPSCYPFDRSPVLQEQCSRLCLGAFALIFGAEAVPKAFQLTPTLWSGPVALRLLSVQMLAFFPILQ